ncbi:MAG: ATP-binding cassette domain-containing protein [Chloroflexaceae bacterium]
MATAAIEAHGLVKRYGEVTAVAGVDLTIAPHNIYALLGPNGAGKTTTISMLTTLVPPSAGSARVAGYDVISQARQVRRQIGVTFQDIVLDLNLTGRQVLDIHGKLYRMRRQERKTRITRLVELVQLEEAIDRRVKTYSGGMKRRLELARGLLTDPQILFLDEPTQGLDPQNRIGIWNYIRELNREQGMTLLLTTHYMEEAEALAHAVGIIDHGKMVAEGKPASLVSALGADVIRVHGQGDQQHFLDTLGTLPFVEQVQIDEQDNLVQVFVDNGNRRLVEVVQAASGNGFRVEDIAVAQPSLGDVFLRHTGRTFRD